MAITTVPIIVDWESIKNYLAKSDIVEVMRCKDCKCGILTGSLDESSDVRYCYRHHMFHFNDYYCAEGEREETENGFRSVCEYK